MFGELDQRLRDDAEEDDGGGGEQRRGDEVDAAAGVGVDRVGLGRGAGDRRALPPRRSSPGRIHIAATTRR